MIDVRTYARVMAELAAAGVRGRDAVLARHGLDEATWSAADDHWQDALSEALDPFDAEVSGVLSAYAAAYDAAQRELSQLLSLERFAEATRLIQQSDDLQAALARAEVTLADFVRASEHWGRRMIEEPELERRFEEALRIR